MGVNSPLLAQEYYWSGNQKNPLIQDNSKIVANIEEGTNIKNRIEEMQGVKKIDRINSTTVIIEFDGKNSKVNEELISLAANRIFAYFNEDGSSIIPTGEILFRPKEGVTIEEINKICDNLLIVTNKSYGSYTATVKDYSKIFQIANKLYETGHVEYSHPNFISKLKMFQNDPLYPDQYYLNNTGQFGGTPGIDINAPEVWAITTGLANVRVAVIDDGVENHPDIDGRVVDGYTIGNPNGNGAPLAGAEHGQACAGIIAATRNNNEGIAGIAPCSEIVPINISVPFVTAGQIRDAIDWAWDEGESDVLSNSWGYPSSDAITQAIGRARSQGRNGKGSIVVFASGNSGGAVAFPGNVAGVITVGAVDRNGNLWAYSSRGPEMDIVAPSGNTNLLGDIRTTDRQGANGYNGGNYVNNFGGTSAACPQVAGVVALMLSYKPSMTESQVSNILKSTATGTGFNNNLGHGRLNAQAALQQTIPIIEGPSMFCPSATMEVAELDGGSITWSVSPSNALSFTQGQSSTTFTRIGSFTGSAVITATLNPSCGTTQVISKNVSVGLAPINNVSFSNGADGEEYLCTSHTGNTYQIYPNTANTTYQYRLRSYPNLTVVYTSPPGQYNTGTINYIPSQGWYEFQVRTTNACGTSSWAGFEVEYVDCTQIGNRSNHSTFVYPNPANSQLYIKRIDADLDVKIQNSSKLEPFRAELYNLSGLLIKEKYFGNLGEESTLDVSNIQKGNYFLKIVAKEIEETHQIIIQ